ncbi:hypothetical protein CBS101457_003313 [Exobasidium rhododendri]|nr:hypothetical protein CBS101457_003313 [Exobasidium rhododendri]
MALSMSLHQCSRTSGKKQKSRMEEQEERRTFWGLYIMEVVVAYLLRLPPLLRAEDADRELPDLDERDEYEIWLNDRTRKFVSVPQAEAMTGVRTHAISSFLAWVQVMKEHESIRKDLRRDLPSGTGVFERMYRQRSQRLQAFKDQLPQHLQWYSPFVDPEAANFTNLAEYDIKYYLAMDSHGGVTPQVLLMRAWYSECCMLLHRPCVGEGQQGSESARLCLCAATEVCAIVSAYERSFGINLMQSGFIHIIFQSATLLAAMESVYQIYGHSFWNPPLPTFPIASLFDQCFAWLEKLSTRYPFANHYLSILASLSKAHAQSWSGSTTQMQRGAIESDATVTMPIGPTPSSSTTQMQQQQQQPELDHTSTSLTPLIEQNPIQLPEDFWDIVPFDGENLNEWLSGIESFVPM